MTTKLEKPLKNCVILYSRRHFDPNSSTDLENSSAGLIARTIYTEMKSKSYFEVYYFDSFDNTEWLKVETDILISLVDNLSLGIWFFDPKEVIVIAVNQHPLARLQICGSAARKGIPVSAISPSDGVYQPYKSLTKTKAIICVGNSETKDSFEQYLKNTKVVLATYDTSFSSHTQEASQDKIENVLILMSSIGYRKGFDRIFESLILEKESLKSYRFHLIGHSEGEYWDQKIKFLENHTRNFTYHGWLLNSDEKFISLLRTMDLALFPTREEGLVGSLLECIDLGIVSMHTKSSGVNNSVPELILSSVGDLHLAEHLNLFASMNKTALSQLRDKQRKELKNQFATTLPMETALRVAIESESGGKKAKLRLLRLVFVWLNFPILQYRKILVNRFKLIRLRQFLMKLSLKKPNLYNKIRNIYRFFR